MAWSDAARRAALLVRQSRKHSDYVKGYQTYHTGNIGGRKISTERGHIALYIRQARSGRSSFSLSETERLVGAARVSTDFRNMRRTGKAVPRLARAINKSVAQSGRR